MGLGRRQPAQTTLWALLRPGEHPGRGPSCLTPTAPPPTPPASVPPRPVVTASHTVPRTLSPRTWACSDGGKANTCTSSEQRAHPGTGPGSEEGREGPAGPRVLLQAVPPPGHALGDPVLLLVGCVHQARPCHQSPCWTLQQLPDQGFPRTTADPAVGGPAHAVALHGGYPRLLALLFKVRNHTAGWSSGRVQSLFFWEFHGLLCASAATELLNHRPRLTAPRGRRI
ncbi:sterile alpha motif domain-containing protein 1-like isoform X2 [Leopardus geoffroyi]|uniref:sterile alpha motif domain-containing protein 1-like isoform X2 n=1 Tax=Leopardus geoffroyi TaxID=46844 RepID=UPI001E262191|nr:sterile alpha motif domain-containing protein 1-like isoform X2 [Leopardus geoffroyi]